MFKTPRAEKRKSPLQLSRQRARNSMSARPGSDRHRRQRAGRVMVMAVMAMSQHRTFKK
jgi:hypothetical protein